MDLKKEEIEIELEKRNISDDLNENNNNRYLNTLLTFHGEDSAKNPLIKADIKSK